ncbi:hypothetical protein [Oceanobacter antarcticus]|uniref:O-antigen ligase like membrane protein n=1 Tax=Oceanobacter antarcticus TaxID=3133425 RepID=A0ABW8NEJ0_9GAMM
MKVFLFLFLVFSFIPNEAYLSIGGVRFEAYRILLIFYFFAAVGDLAREKMQFFEKMLFCYCLWCSLSFMYIYGVGGIQTSLIQFLEMYMVYFMGRMYTLRAGWYGLIKFLKIIGAFFILMIPLAVYESQTGNRITHSVVGAIFGNYAASFAGYNYFRMGVFRSSVIFAHPILYSVIAFSMLLPVLYVFKGGRRNIYLFSYVVAGFTAMTSAGFLMLIVQLGFVVLEKISLKISLFKRIFYFLVFAFLVYLEVFSNRGALKFLIMSISLDPVTAFTRYIQWDQAWDDIIDNPFFGIGFEEWSRPSWLGYSIDSYWLLAMVNNGLVSIVFLSAFWVGMVRNVYTMYKMTNDFVYYIFFAVVMSLIFAAFTVDLFDRAQTLTYLYFGIISGLITNQKKLKLQEGSDGDRIR